MIARFASGGSICLRCQLRLTGSVPPRLPRPLARSIFSRRHGTNAAEASVDDGQGAVEGEQAHVRKVAMPGLPPTAADSFVSKGRLLAVRPEALDIDILGEKAAAIVLRNMGAAQRRARVRIKEEDTPKDHTSVIETIEVEAGPLTAEAVQANIDELRPRGSNVISEATFHDLARTLVDGFTLSQLKTYIRRNSRRPEPAPAAFPTDMPWILKQFPWVPATPGVSETGEAMQRSRQGSTDKPPTAQEKLAVRLLCECWDLVTQETIEGDGHLDVRLRDVEFMLLTLGVQQWLQTVGQLLLKREESRIDLFPDENTVRIVAPKTAAEATLAHINTILQGAPTKSFKLADVTLNRRALTAPMLRELGRITNCVVRLDESGEHVLVTWIDPETRNPGVEDPHDAVFRLLLTAFGPRKDIRHLVVGPQLGNAGARFVQQELGSKERLPWAARFGIWERWAKHLDVETLVKSPTAASKMLHWEIEKPSPPTDTAEGHVGWTSAPAVSTIAVFGHVLHLHRNDRRPLPTNAQQRILVPVLPLMSELHSFNSADMRTTPACVVLRFLPSPTDPLAASAPLLELTIEDPKDVVIASLRAITGSHVSDCLHPARRVDYRVTQTQAFSLSGRAVGALPDLAPLVQFLSRSLLDMDQGSLETPSRLQGLRFPRRLLRQPPDAAETDTVTPKPDGVEETVAVDYLFAGLEARQSVVASFEGWRAAFTNIEAGKGGGRRVEMSLEAVYDAERDELVSKLDAKHYVNAIETMAQGARFRWVGDAEGLLVQ